MGNHNLKQRLTQLNFELNKSIRIMLIYKGLIEPIPQNTQQLINNEDIIQYINSGENQDQIVILKYIAKSHAPELIGIDPLQEAQINSLEQTLQQIKQSFIVLLDDSHSNISNNDLIQHVHNQIKSISVRFKENQQNQYLFGSKICYLDFFLYSLLEYVEYVSDREVYDYYPKLKYFAERITWLDRVEKAFDYYKSDCKDYLLNNTQSNYKVDQIKTDKTVLSRILDKEIISVKNKSMACDGGASGELFRLFITTNDSNHQDKQQTVVFKFQANNKEKLDWSIFQGLTREAYFYEELSHHLTDLIPKIYFSYGDLATGRKILIMEDLANNISTQQFFDKEHPRQDIDKLSMAKYIICATAKLHAQFWENDLLYKCFWLKGYQFIKGQNQKYFDDQVGVQKYFWGLGKHKIKNIEQKWGKLLIDCMQASIDKLSFQQYQIQMQQNWTLIHGDLHSKNMMWDPKQNKIIFLDWEFVGFGNGLSDIGYFLISGEIEDRRKWEPELLQQYYKELKSNIKVETEQYTFEKCLQNYKDYGCTRNLWILNVFTYTAGDHPFVQILADRLAAFLSDHKLTPQNIQMMQL